LGEDDSIKVSVIKLIAEEQGRLQKKAAYAVYCGARPFGLYQDHYLADLITSLHPGFKSPSEWQLRNTLFDDCYKETLREVCTVIRRCEWLNISIDESSTSGTKERVFNYCIITNTGTFCMKQEVVGLGALTAERQADWLDNQLDELFVLFKQFFGDDAELPLVNSVATDICAIMRKMWIDLKARKRFKYTLFIPCDSHGVVTQAGLVRRKAPD
jgi:hypothetical protein